MLITSSYLGWGTGSLARDVEDMAQAVEYFRNRTEEGKKVVIMGHSTGEFYGMDAYENERVWN